MTFGAEVVTYTGFALIAFARTRTWVLAAVVLLAVPRLIGAPHPQILTGVMPPTIEGLFAGHSITVAVVNRAVWAILPLGSGLPRGFGPVARLRKSI